ncbi:response regulator transcription factor [Roseovarius sp. EGI FJ00037]|uniref:response regulator transcription factor n=1 Tax=Roseovarius salincola TaxID=2978479 RepID=UPI0022A87668|nr:response regulator transcription factor [Roseovarius sp. EGI FJ00037]MCZ0813652.1 response regulator transcription factor [Roseovarius sp. EGI FJ00037]
MSEAISVLVVDDHQLVCDAVVTVLSTIDGFSVTGCHSLKEAEEILAASGSFDVVMLDLFMSDMQGMLSVERVVKLNKGGNVVIFSGRSRQVELQAALDIGCKGMVPKDLPLVSLESTIRLVASGEVFVRFDRQEASNGHTTKCAALDDVELIIIQMVADGRTNKEIARFLKRSEVTVKSYMRKICVELDARNRANAVTRAKELNLI